MDDGNDYATVGLMVAAAPLDYSWLVCQIEDFRSCLATRQLYACLHVSGGDWCRSCSPARLLLACLHVGSAVDDSLRSCLLAQLLLACLHVNNHVNDCIRILVDMRKMSLITRKEVVKFLSLMVVRMYEKRGRKKKRVAIMISKSDK